ncbi:MAG: hypothetical protein ABI581_08170 [Sediminibacterium sp.]
MKGKILDFTEVYIYDSSGQIAILMASLKLGVITGMLQDIPQWVEDILFIPKRLQQKKEIQQAEQLSNAAAIAQQMKKADKDGSMGMDL